MRPTITVITPTHPARLRNGLLARAQASLTTQALMPDAHIVEIDLDRQGAAPTRDRALRKVTTDWVAPLDSDDLFLPRHLSLLLDHALETGADFVYSWFKIMDARGRVLEDDPIFPPGHYLNPFDGTPGPDPADPYPNAIETTITVLVRTELAQAVGYHALDRGEVNSGEDRAFTLGCLAAGGKISHLVAKTWLWGHTGQNTSGLPTKGDAANG